MLTGGTTFDDRRYYVSLDAGSGTPLPNQLRNPHLGVHYVYPDPDTSLGPTEVTLRLSPLYGIHTACDAHDGSPRVVRENEEFEVETGPCRGTADSVLEVVRGAIGPASMLRRTRRREQDIPCPIRAMIER